MNSLILLLIYATQINGKLLHLQYSATKENLNFYQKLLQEIHNEQNYDTLLIMQHYFTKDERLQQIFAVKKAKIIIDMKHRNFLYKNYYNSETLAIIIMEYNWHKLLWQNLAENLNLMRQTKILIILINNLQKIANVQNEILKTSENYKMTNILVHLLNTSQEVSREYWQLKPFPVYHFKKKSFSENNTGYYPKHWHNMRGKIIYTLPDQIEPRSLVWTDLKGDLQLSGFTAKLVQLFAEKYNASLKFPYPVKVNEITHLSKITNMTNQGLLDIPMSLDSSFTGEKWLRISYPLEIGQWMIMIPCAQAMKTHQVFKSFLTPQLFAIILNFILIFSILLAVMEKLFYYNWNWVNVCVNDKVIPGILGQSFILRKLPLYSVRFVYILIFLLGLLMGTYFSAHLKTLITTPPKEKQLKTFNDFRLAGKKIMLDIWDIKNLNTNDNGILEKMQGTIVYIDNTTLYHQYRKHFNTSNSYTVTTGLWNVFTKNQEFFTHKLFCISKEMIIMDFLLLGIPLQEHSLYREPLDYLIHQVNSVGLFHIWHSNTFYDMLKLGKISLKDTTEKRSSKAFTDRDLLILWYILLIGQSSSFVIFLLEVYGSDLREILRNIFFKLFKLIDKFKNIKK